MPANDHLGAQFERMYHASSPNNRHGIIKEGLNVDYDQGEGYTPRGVYMSPQPSTSSHEDVWEVNVKGVKLEPDSPSQMREFQDVGGSWFSSSSIPSSRLRLHREAPR